MTKRTAILMAGGLVLSLVSGTTALWMGRGIVGASASAPARVPKPIVRVVTQEVTVHQQAAARPEWQWAPDDHDRSARGSERRRRSGYEDEHEGSGHDD